MITGQITEADLQKLDADSLKKLHTSVSIPLPQDLGQESLVANLMGHLNSISSRSRNLGPNYTVTVVNGNTTARSTPAVQAATGGCKTCG